MPLSLAAGCRDDYLAVNVWTPAAAMGDLPVMVFVHGGGFVAGSTRAALYDGSVFARDGVVLVTVNYRHRGGEPLPR